MVNLTVNGQGVTVPDDASVLHAVRAAGVELPTLCHHDGLAPYGACRLCMVMISKPNGKGNPGGHPPKQGGHKARPYELVASCVHPVEEGLAVETEAEEAVAARRMALEFLLSRCPSSVSADRSVDVIRDLAAQEGVLESRFGELPPEHKPANELCVLCGLCVRVCREAIGANAISFIGRGMERRVGTPFEVQSEACIGCGACAEICPTGAIKMEDRGDGKRILHTWNTTVELHACPVCGRHFAPQPTEFLTEMFPEVEDVWGLCPECLRRRTARQWIE
jgi:bidirectional [NiFe] hydrogenase diaphorase subunit